MSVEIRSGTHAGVAYVVAIANGSSGQDRAHVVQMDDGIVVVLADGAGGTGRGADAASAVIAAIERAPTADAASLLYEIDEPSKLGGGETTAVLVSVTRSQLRGASVGDSGAWLVSGADVTDLTAAQERKPLLGAGATPVELRGELSLGATLLVASDGLLRYAKPADVARVLRENNLATAAAALVELVRLPSDGLQDDVSVVLCRRTDGT